jgi:hypothetical protein
VLTSVAVSVAPVIWPVITVVLALKPRPLLPVAVKLPSGFTVPETFPWNVEMLSPATVNFGSKELKQVPSVMDAL